jgi:hypothetical protein
MKRYVLLFFLLMGGAAYAQQCTPEVMREYTRKCVNQLRPHGYTFLKSYRIDASSNKTVEYSYIFNRGQTYMITFANESNPEEFSGILFELFDGSRRKLIDNFNPALKEYRTAVAFRCSQTGIYYLKFTFEPSVKDYCLVSVVGFKR